MTPSNPINPSKQYTLQTPSEIFTDVIKDVLKRTGKSELPTGIESFDELTWGLHKKELLVVGARPSHGKSSFLINIAWFLAKLGKSVCFLSLEMSRQAVMERMACIEYGLRGWDLRCGVVHEIKKLQEVESAMQTKLITMPLFVFDKMGKTIQEVDQVLKDMKPDVLFIDHAQKIVSRGFGNKYEALSDYVNRLQSLAIEYDCAIVLASQINRTGAKESNGMDYLKGAGDIEECADTLAICKWKIKDDPNYPEEKDYEITIQKQRHGPTDRVIISFDGANFRMTDKQTKPRVPTFGIKDFD